jgi:SHS2 domain-containing protein
MKEYKFLAHTADMRLQVQATTLEELFSAALEGMNTIIKPEAHACTKGDVEKTLILSSSDSTSLLIDFLSEVLTLSVIHKAIFFHVSFELLSNLRLKAILTGMHVSSFNEDIKAVTYHNAQVVRGPDGVYQVTITFDI